MIHGGVANPAPTCRFNNNGVDLSPIKTKLKIYIYDYIYMCVCITFPIDSPSGEFPSGKMTNHRLSKCFCLLKTVT